MGFESPLLRKPPHARGFPLSQPRRSMARIRSPTTVTKDERIGILRGVDPFATIPDEPLAAVAARFRLEHYEPGATVFEEGDPGDRLFVVVSGAGEISARGPA